LSFDPREYIAKPRSWFSPAVIYEGTGRADFEHPEFSVEGDVSIVIHENGRATIEMLVSYENSDDLLLEELFVLVARK
jgi:hypothetical protein